MRFALRNLGAGEPSPFGRVLRQVSPDRREIARATDILF
ncbi:hypothetical protein ACCUM_3801 [Candidatus Accumulibacter phosphatis]|uniref:Uncharacterized protein n=1 Tax=Candidatus Accumulibacter phosphatis TaxID=327160 RepID=A0A5S4END4_9PROT|nr:hypothetical protein ACCUM_3801 [Candidatus Accumulibacter phosphatis]